MPHETTTQPLTDQPPRDSRDQHLVKDVLGEQAAAEMNELTHGANQPTQPAEQGIEDEIEISAGEHAATSEAEKSMAEKRRDEYIAWAITFDENEDWVNETFEFNKDGTVIAPRDIYIENRGIDCFPPGLIEVGGSLWLKENNFESLESLPRHVGGSLYIGRNKVSSLEGMPETIGGVFHAAHNQITSLEGISQNIGNAIILEANQITSLEGLQDTVNGELNLLGNKITELNGISKTIKGELTLIRNPITSLDALQNVTVEDRIVLYGIPATSIPTGLKVAQEIEIGKKQTELILDAQNKSYQVIVV